jgi:cephalosporin hydroxylase
MYDFYFGSEETIKQDESTFLLFIKRLLPRWCNSIPDSEYIAIFNLLKLKEQNSVVLVETGVGASTLVLLNHAIKHNGVLYSWDTNPNKGAFLRSVIQDTLLKRYDANIWKHWQFIAYNSTSPHLGIPILKELGQHVDYCFLDSEHTRDVLLGEVKSLNPLLREGAIVSIDDANYTHIYQNTSYINLQRKKMGIPPIENPKDNVGNPFFEEVENYLKDHWNNVDYLKDTYKMEYPHDIYWAYYNSDRDTLRHEKMEIIDSLEHRFDAWCIRGKK